jgi:hypothetical protein
MGDIKKHKENATTGLRVKVNLDGLGPPVIVQVVKAEVTSLLLARDSIELRKI